MPLKPLPGKRSAKTILERLGTRYESCPPWVPGAVELCTGLGLVPRPAVVIWHARATSRRWGTCWPREGRIHVYPWSGHRREVLDDLFFDVSGELDTARIGSRVIPGAQEQDDLEDTLAHELAHLVHAAHGPEHTVLTARLAAEIGKHRPR